MKITPRLFDAFLKCPTKCYLRSLGEVEAGNAYASWLQTQAESYQAAVVERLRRDAVPCDLVVSPHVDDLKTGKWRLAVNVVAHTQGMESEIQALERLPAEGRGKTARFLPVRFVPNNKLSRDNKFLLAFDALVLSTTLGREIAAGKIVHGDNHAVRKVNTAALTGQVRKIVANTTALVTSKSPPDLILNRHCPEGPLTGIINGTGFTLEPIPNSVGPAGNPSRKGPGRSTRRLSTPSRAPVRFATERRRCIFWTEPNLSMT